MNICTSVSARRLGASIALAAAYSTLFGTTPADAAGVTPSVSISFAAKVPATEASLPLYRLAHNALPTAFVQHTLGVTHAASLGIESNRFVARDQKHVVRAFADPLTGETQIFPDLGAHGGPAPRPELATGVARSVFARTDIIPKDATQARLGAATRVFSASAHLDAKKTSASRATEVLFTYVPAIRFAHGLQVYGRGSRATVAVGNDGSLRGLVRRWQTALPAGNVRATASASAVQAAIAQQLRPLTKLGAIVVDSVKPAYYDGDKNYLQPVYVFSATIHAPRRGISNDHVRGFVPFGKLVEALPVLNSGVTGAAPVAPQKQMKRGLRPMNDGYGGIMFGEYANRDGSMLDMADAYNNGFAQNRPWWAPPIDRDQWLWAYSFEVQSDANYYLNAMQVAYTQPHGDWYVNTTYSNDLGTGDPWYITNIGLYGNPGLGAASGGQLSTWIIDSCEVIPSMYDLGFTTGNPYNAFNAWWSVFQGLHRALGFRTEMLLGMDDMNYGIAQNMALGAASDSAFFNGVASVDFGTYADYHLNNMSVRYDRASLMEDTRNDGESIYSTYGQSASSELRNVWMDN